MKQGLPMPFLYSLHLLYILLFVPVSQLMYDLLYLNCFPEYNYSILHHQNDTRKNPNNQLRQCLQ